MAEQTSIVSKIWSMADVLRDDGVGYGDYLEQLTYILFLKMVDELTKPPYNNDIHIPEKFNWESLRSRRGADLEIHYNTILAELGREKGLLGDIFTKAMNRIQDPAKLYKVIDMIDREQWSLMGGDIKGSIYEGLLEKNAEDVKSGAGQYFTPRALIKAMVECVAPRPQKTICDPACGTGGFFLAAYDFIGSGDLNIKEKKFLKNDTFFGNEIVANTRRLALMNMFLHQIGEIDQPPHIDSTDSLISRGARHYDYVLTNPPFGKKSSMTFTNERGEQEKHDLTYSRQDFWTTTSNKQLNFLQHIVSVLKIDGSAAVVLPDNVLFEGGSGEIVRKKLMETCELHTILRLPTGIFYAQGVKANVLFFEKRAASKVASTKEVWVYDYRTNIHHTLKKQKMEYSHLVDFIKCYTPSNIYKRKETWSEEQNPDGRWRRYTYEEIIERDKTNLDIFWLKDKSLTDLENLPSPEILAAEIIEDLEAGLESFREIEDVLEEL